MKANESANRAALADAASAVVAGMMGCDGVALAGMSDVARALLDLWSNLPPTARLVVVRTELHAPTSEAPGRIAVLAYDASGKLWARGVVATLPPTVPQ